MASGRGRARGRAKARGHELYRDSRDYDEYRSTGTLRDKYGTRYDEDYYKRDEEHDEYPSRQGPWIENKDRYGARFDKYRDVADPIRSAPHEDTENDHYERNMPYKSSRIADKKKFDDRDYYDRKELEKDEDKILSKYDHDQSMLNRKGRAPKPGYPAHEPGDRPPTYQTGRGSGRGDRGGYLTRGRGSS